MVETTENLLQRNTWNAVFRGTRLRCPCCGEGKVLHRYLKVNDRCAACDLDLTHARADDGPAYLTILLVCHIAGFLLHFVWVKWEPSPLMMASTITVACVAMSLFLLPRFKGLIIGFQWAKRMHGF